jgi:hypothetical protein
MIGRARVRGARVVTVTSFAALHSVHDHGVSVYSDREKIVVDACRRGAARVVLRWPEIRTKLGARIESDSRLAELCEAYETACTAAEYWLRSKADVAPERAEEYRALAAATEQDILEALA